MLPPSTAGNGSGSSQMSFPYFPLYVLDENNGIVLFNNQYQQSSPSGIINLYAQVKGTTVSTYSWTTSGLSIASSSGASTYNFQFQLSSLIVSPEVGSVTLTVTNTSSQQESETMYFVVPTTSVVTMPYSASWPVDDPAQPRRARRPVDRQPGGLRRCRLGALDTEIDLPSYNPNVPALALTYNSMTANPLPIVVVHHTLHPARSVPTTVNATLTFNGRWHHLVLQHEQPSSPATSSRSRSRPTRPA